MPDISRSSVAGSQSDIRFHRITNSNPPARPPREADPASEAGYQSADNSEDFLMGTS